MIRFCASAPVACIVLLTSINVVPAEPLPTETFKILPAALAVEAAQAALAACKTQGYTISVSIVDRAGNPKLLLVGHGASALKFVGSVGAKPIRRPCAAFRRASLAKQVAAPGAFNPALYDTQLALRRAAYRSSAATRRSEPLESVVRPEAIRTKPVPTLASPRSAIGSISRPSGSPKAGSTPRIGATSYTLHRPVRLPATMPMPAIAQGNRDTVSDMPQRERN